MDNVKNGPKVVDVDFEMNSFLFQHEKDWHNYPSMFADKKRTGMFKDFSKDV